MRTLGMLTSDAGRPYRRRLAAFYGFSASGTPRCPPGQTSIPSGEVNLPCLIYMQGDKGAGVMALQKRLTQLGFDTKGADGVYGPNTESAVQAYAATVDLPYNGGVDGALMGHLNMGATSSTAPIAVTPAGLAPVRPAGQAIVATTDTPAPGIADTFFGPGGGPSSILGTGGPSKAMVIGVGLAALALGGIIWYKRKVSQVPVIGPVLQGLFGSPPRRRRRRRRS